MQATPVKLKEIESGGILEKSWLTPESIHKMTTAEPYTSSGSLWVRLKHPEVMCFTCVKSPYKSAIGVQRKDGKWYWELASDLEM